jgi:DNA-binding CsgD family transcriptional regulator
MHRPIVLLQLPTLSGSVLVVPPGGGSLLGRSTRCDLVLDHPSVSRRHASLAVAGAGVRVTDLGSKNGTFVEDLRVAGTAVAPLKSRVRFGSLDFLVTGREEIAEELDSSLDTEGTPRLCRTRAGGAEPEPLSAAQRRVFRLLLDGLSEKRIAARLRASPCTVHNHVGAIYRAFGVHSRAELLVHALLGKPQRDPAGSQGRGPGAAEGIR